MTEKQKTKRLRIEVLIRTFVLTFVICGLLVIAKHEQNAMATELGRRPAIGYPIHRGEYTIFIMNMDLHEVYWFTNCPRLKDFTRHEEVAIYGDHQNHCQDWRTLTPSEHDLSKK